MKSTNKGFTLIELLVVIGVIIILTGVLIVAIDPVAIMRKGRDARRLDELDTLNKAIALGLAEGEISLVDTDSLCGVEGCNMTDDGDALDGSGYVRYSITPGDPEIGLEKYIPRLPIDPLNTGSNVFIFSSDGNQYELNVVLESTDNAAKMSTDGGSEEAVYEIGTNLNIL